METEKKNEHGQHLETGRGKEKEKDPKRPKELIETARDSMRNRIRQEWRNYKCKNVIAVIEREREICRGSLCLCRSIL